MTDREGAGRGAWRGRQDDSAVRVREWRRSPCGGPERTERASLGPGQGSSVACEGRAGETDRARAARG